MKWFSAAQVAKIWGSVTATVISHIDDGTLCAINIARRGSVRRRWRISEKHIAEFEQSRRNEPAKDVAAKSASRRTIAKPTKDYFAPTGGAK